MRNTHPQLCWMESTHRLDGSQFLSEGWHGAGWHGEEFALGNGLGGGRSVSAVRPGESGSFDYCRVTLAALLSSALAAACAAFFTTVCLNKELKHRSGATIYLRILATNDGREKICKVYNASISWSHFPFLHLLLGNLREASRGTPTCRQPATRTHSEHSPRIDHLPHPLLPTSPTHSDPC